MNNTSHDHREVFLQLFIMLNQNSFTDKDVFDNVLNAGVSFTANDSNNIFIVFFGKMEDQYDCLGIVSSGIAIDDDVLRFRERGWEIGFLLKLHPNF